MGSFLGKARALKIGLAALAATSLATPALAGSFLGESFDCESASSDLSYAFDAHPAPTNAGLIPQLQHLMWMLESAIALLDRECSYESNYSSVRGEYARALNQTRTVCQQSASSPGLCYARRYN